MKLFNLYNLDQRPEPMHSLLSTNRVKVGLGRLNDLALNAWLKTAKIGDWYTLPHPISKNLRVKRIQ